MRLLLLLPFITHLRDIKIGQFSQFWTMYNNGCQSNSYYQLLLLHTCKCKILCIWNHLISRLRNYLYMHELSHDPRNRIKQMFLGHLWNSQEYKEWSFITLYSSMGLPCGNKWKIIVNWYFFGSIHFQIDLYSLQNNCLPPTMDDWNIIQMTTWFVNVSLINFHSHLSCKLCVVFLLLSCFFRLSNWATKMYFPNHIWANGAFHSVDYSFFVIYHLTPQKIWSPRLLTLGHMVKSNFNVQYISYIHAKY